jgi:hypothetical protein
MKNIKAKVKDGILILKIDLSKEGEKSSTGLSKILAKTSKFEALECAEDLGLMLVLTKRLIKKDKKKKSKED